MWLPRLLCRLGFHFYWNLIADRGAWVYRECDLCGRRKAWQIPGRIGPRADEWLAGGEFREAPIYPPPWVVNRMIELHHRPRE